MDLIERTKAEELAKRFALNDGEEWNINIGRIVKIGAQVEFDLALIHFSHNSPHRLMLNPIISSNCFPPREIDFGK